MELQFDYVKVESNQLTFDLEMQHKVLPKLPKADPELSHRTVPGPHRKTAGDKEAFLFVTFGLVEEFTGESRYEAVVVVGAHDRAHDELGFVELKVWSNENLRNDSEFRSFTLIVLLSLFTTIGRFAFSGLRSRLFSGRTPTAVRCPPDR